MEMGSSVLQGAALNDPASVSGGSCIRVFCLDGSALGLAPGGIVIKSSAAANTSACQGAIGEAVQIATDPWVLVIIAGESLDSETGSFEYATTQRGALPNGVGTHISWFPS